MCSKVMIALQVMRVLWVILVLQGDNSAMGVMLVICYEVSALAVY